MKKISLKDTLSIKSHDHIVNAGWKKCLETIIAWLMLQGKNLIQEKSLEQKIF